jgi:CRP-like cAMP-binding protein
MSATDDASDLGIGTSQEPTHSALEPMVRQLQFWCTLDSADRQAILSLPHTVKKLHRLEYIVREGDTATGSCVMLAGYSIRHKTVLDGARQIVAIHMKGEIVDLQNSLFGIRRSQRADVDGWAGGDDPTQGDHSHCL